MNEAGTRTLRHTFTTPASLSGLNTIRLYGGDAPGQARVRWDDIGLYEGALPPGGNFTGDSADRDGMKFAWVGAANGSPSVAYR